MRLLISDRGVPEDDLASWFSGDFLRIPGTDVSQAAYATESISISLPPEGWRLEVAVWPTDGS